MESKIQKWGNSNGVRIPKVFLDALNLKKDDLVDIKKEEDKIVITKIKRENVSLKERIEQYDGPNLCEDFTWDENVGKEIW